MCKFFWIDNPQYFHNTYSFNFHLDTVFHDQLVDGSILNIGAHCDQFEPVADFMGVEKFVLTSDFIDSLFTSQINDIYNYLDSEVYAPFQITRETIENATPEQLQLLYDLAKSIWSINIDLEYPNIPARDFGNSNIEP